MTADRYFDPDSTVRRHARAIYDSTRALPIVSPHGHVDAALLAKDEPFPDPSALLITPDHYILRLLYSHGVSLESLGVAPIDGMQPGAETDAFAIWDTFARHYHLFRATPTRAWLDYQLHELFGVDRELTAESSRYVHDAVAERLRSPEFRPRALFKRFNIEVLATTDAATASLEHHLALRQVDLGGRIVPTFRPDALFRIASPAWSAEFAYLERVVGMSLASCADFVKALAARRNAFSELGAIATDHAVVEPRTERLDDAEAERLFAKAYLGAATLE